MRITRTAPGRALLVICLASACWSFSFGAGAPLASLWLKQVGCSETIIGLNTAVYYAGLALAALVVPVLMRRLGPRCTTLGMGISALAVALFPWGNTLNWWFGMRLLAGIGAALCLIPMETYVNRDLPPEHRARNFGLYAIALTLGWALGNWVALTPLAGLPQVAFLAAGTAALGAALIVKKWLPAIPEQGQAPTVALDWRDNFISFGAAWSQGFLEGGMVAFLPLYLIALGLGEQYAGWLISATMLGVIVFQVPVAWLADFFGRLPVLLACFAAVVVGLGALPLAGTSSLLPVWLFVVGAFSGAFYPLGLALLGENLPPGELDRANAWYLSMECLGCLAGPALMGLARDWAGEKAMFVVGEAAVILVLACWLMWRPKEALAASVVDQSEAPRRAA
jgi:MFS family permease